MTKLHLGSGYKKINGFVNIDSDELVKPDLLLNLDDENIIERMSGRRVHISSGRNYHVKFNPPKKEGFDDLTGEELIQRDDDTEATVSKRLEVFRDQTKPVVDFYANQNSIPYVVIDGTPDTSIVKEKVLDTLAQHNS